MYIIIIVLLILLILAIIAICKSESYGVVFFYVAIDLVIILYMVITQNITTSGEYITYLLLIIGYFEQIAYHKKK